jgi:hypothetical protein
METVDLQAHAFSDGNLVDEDIIYVYQRTVQNYPLDRIHLLGKNRASRIQHDHLRFAWALYVWARQAPSGLAPLPAFTWCGTPTGGYCDVCPVGQWAGAVCSDCEAQTQPPRPWRAADVSMADEDRSGLTNDQYDLRNKRNIDFKVISAKIPTSGTVR